MSRFSVQTYMLFACQATPITLFATFGYFTMLFRLILHILMALSLVPSNDIERFVS